MIHTTPKDLWIYDKTFKSPYTFKDELLYGLYIATVKKSDGKRHSYKSLAEAEADYKARKLPVNLECIINKKVTTYGRAKLTELSNIDIENFLKYHVQLNDSEVILLDENEDTITKEQRKNSNVYIIPKRLKGENISSYKDKCDSIKKKYKEALEEYKQLKAYKKDKQYSEMNGLGMNNIAKFCIVLGTHPNRIKEYVEIQKFAAEIATITGLGPVPYKELFNKTQKEIDDILNAEFVDEDGNEILNPEARNAEAMERKSKVRKLFEKTIAETLQTLPHSNIRELQQSMGKVSIDKLVTVYAPTITGDTLEELRATVGDSLFNGVGEQVYYSMAEQNRGTLEMKQESVPTSRQ